MRYDGTVDRIVGLFRDGDEYRAASMINSLARSGDPEQAAAGDRAILRIASEFPDELKRREILSDYLRIDRMTIKRAGSNRRDTVVAMLVAISIIALFVVALSVAVWMGS